MSIVCGSVLTEFQVMVIVPLLKATGRALSSRAIIRQHSCHICYLLLLPGLVIVMAETTAERQKKLNEVNSCIVNYVRVVVRDQDALTRRNECD